MFKYYFKTFGTCKNLFVWRKFDSGKKWSNLAHLGVGRCIWAACTRARGTVRGPYACQERYARARCTVGAAMHAWFSLRTPDARWAPMRVPKGPMHAPKVSCASRMAPCASVGSQVVLWSAHYCTNQPFLSDFSLKLISNHLKTL